MDEQQKTKKLKVVIIILAILLAISSVALAGTLIYKHFAPAGPGSVIVPDNIITPEADDFEETQIEPDETEESTDTAIEEITEETTESSVSAEGQSSNETVRTGVGSNRTTRSPVSSSTANDADETATAIYLHKRNSGDNTPFHAGNMFPGDVETRYFCVQVSYKDTVTVKYHADIRPGYEKLAEVLKCKIVLLTTGETMYHGLMRDMPKSLSHTLRAASETTADLYYEITAYLDTSVGNEYQNKELIADFRWWVEEEDHLAEPPQTGDNADLALWSGLIIGSLFLLILLFATRKKEERYEQYR